MCNRTEIDDAVVIGPDGEWDEPNQTVRSEKTYWSEDFAEDPNRPRWTHAVSISPQLRSKIMLKCGHACVHCGATEQLQIDHIRPKSHGGDESEENLQILCRSCNMRKGSQTETRWLTWDGHGYGSA